MLKIFSLTGNRYGTRLLQKVEVPIISNKECEMWHHWKGINVRIFPEMLCAGFENGQKDACVVKTSSYSCTFKIIYKLFLTRVIHEGFFICYFFNLY